MNDVHCYARELAEKRRSVTGQRPTASGSADEQPLPEQSLAAQAHALRVTADLIEHVGIPGLDLTVNPANYDPEISIQVPEDLGTVAERTVLVARLAAAVGGSATRDEGRHPARSWINAHGEIGGHSVKIFAPVSEGQP
jgi:hypothetical protein